MFLSFCLCHACGISRTNSLLTKTIHTVGSSDLDFEEQSTISFLRIYLRMRSFLASRCSSKLHSVHMQVLVLYTVRVYTLVCARAVFIQNRKNTGWEQLQRYLRLEPSGSSDRMSLSWQSLLTMAGNSGNKLTSKLIAQS